MTNSLTYGFDFYRDHYDTRKRRFDLPSGRAAEIAPGVPDGTFMRAGAGISRTRPTSARAWMLLLVSATAGFLQRRNLRNAEIQGVETILEYRFNDHWRLETALAWTEGTDSDTEEPLRRIPPLNGNARLRYAHDPNLWTEFAAVWADHQKRLAPGDISDPRIGPDGTSGYVVFDLRAGYKL
ncbi:MAG: TonB-dependent receptor domain-containing protein, partial [Gammaproteobacteria bacterium]